MDVKDTSQCTRIWIHIKVLHGCLLVVTLGSICGFWLCLTEIENVRKDLNTEIAKRTMVEFDGCSSKSRTNQINETDNSFSFGDRTTRSSSGEDTSHFIGDRDGEHLLNSVDYDNEQKLIRVKRRTRRKPAYYKDGAVEPKDMMWLTSYSRIPVSSLKLFDLKQFSDPFRYQKVSQPHMCMCPRVILYL